MFYYRILFSTFFWALPWVASAGDTEYSQGLQAEDVFDIAYATDARISPDGTKVAFVRHYADRSSDNFHTAIWLASLDGAPAQPLGEDLLDEFEPRWSPDNSKLAYVSNKGGHNAIWVRSLSSGTEEPWTSEGCSPSRLSWSPDSSSIAYVCHVSADETPEFLKEGTLTREADWAPAPKLTGNMVYRFDGYGELAPGVSQLFVVNGTTKASRRISHNTLRHGGPQSNAGTPSWSPDGQFIYISANNTNNRQGTLEHDTDIYRYGVAQPSELRVTQDDGPTEQASLSPQGSQIAYLGFRDQRLGYDAKDLYVMDLSGGKPRNLTADLDRDIESMFWAPDGDGLITTFTDRSVTQVVRVGLDGTRTLLADGLGSFATAYTLGGSASMARDGTLALVVNDTSSTGDVAIKRPGKDAQRITDFNGPLKSRRTLSTITPLLVSAQGKEPEIAAWIVQPPDMEPGVRYPLILDIHGGPFLSYGPRFDYAHQIMAARGYVVVISNPRGSTGYGRAFAQAVDKAFPGVDYDDLQRVVNAATELEFVDRDNLFIQGGSYGGTMTAYTIGKTSRFRAAASLYPVVDWRSFVLTADKPVRYSEYWLGGPPWDNEESYARHSPISYIGNATTPTLVMCGEEDFRTPLSQSEMLFTALKLAGVETAFVRFPEEAHELEGRPSHMMQKTAITLDWFDHYRK